MDRPLVIGNWKMNLDFVEALHLVQQVGVLLKNQPVEHTDVVVAPPFVDLRSVASLLDAERFAMSLGAQHVNENDHGAHTGEVSVSMLRRLGVEWVIVGHSERRTLYAMYDEVVAATLRRGGRVRAQRRPLRRRASRDSRGGTSTSPSCALNSRAPSMGSRNAWRHS